MSFDVAAFVNLSSTPPGSLSGIIRVRCDRQRRDAACRGSKSSHDQSVGEVSSSATEVVHTLVELITLEEVLLAARQR